MPECIECIECKLKFTDAYAKNRHDWIVHPKDIYQQFYSECFKSGRLHLMSMAFQDNPYN